jgi:uncharacterized protein YjiS (DUF1127 family)
MSTTNNTYPISGGQAKIAGEFNSFLSLLLAGFQQLRARRTERRVRAREMRELYGLSDRELWDVGLSRSDFLAIEQGTYRRD